MLLPLHGAGGGVEKFKTERNKMTRGVKAGTINRSEVMRQAVLMLYAIHKDEGTIPTSARFLFYELVAREIIEKGGLKKRPDQEVINALTQLRKSGQIPWDGIVDETRSIEDYRGAVSIADGVADRIRYIHLDPWHGSAPMILCESRSLVGALRNVAQRYRFKSRRLTASAADSCTPILLQHLSRVSGSFQQAIWISAVAILMTTTGACWSQLLARCTGSASPSRRIKSNSIT